MADTESYLLWEECTFTVVCPAVLATMPFIHQALNFLGVNIVFSWCGRVRGGWPWDRCMPHFV